MRQGIENFADHLLDAVFLVDAAHHIVYVSAACEQILGYTPEEMVGKPILDFVLEEDRERTLDEVTRIQAGDQRIGFENRYRHKDGREVHLMWSARRMEADGLRVGVARDVTEQKHAQRVQAAMYAVSDATHRANDLNTLFPEIRQILRQLVPLDGLAIAIRDKTSEAMQFPCRMSGFDNGDSLPGSIVAECDGVMRNRHPLLLRAGQWSAPAGEAPGTHDYLLMPLVTGDEALGVMILKARSDNSFSAKNIEVLSFVSTQIVTAIERAQMKAELMHAALFDDLTGLPNRKLFRERIHSALSRCRRTGSKMALLYLDIDDFKKINDTFGHAAGDAVLQEFARRIKKCVRQMDTVARLGGDEFVILIEDIRGQDDAASVHEKIQQALFTPILVGQHELLANTSVGIALYPDDGDEMDGLISSADHEMYRTKAGRRKRRGTASATRLK